VSGSCGGGTPGRRRHRVGPAAGGDRRRRPDRGRPRAESLVAKGRARAAAACPWSGSGARRPTRGGPRISGGSRPTGCSTRSTARPTRRGNPGVGTMLALVRHGVPVLAWLWPPALGLLVTPEHGSGAAAGCAPRSGRRRPAVGERADPGPVMGGASSAPAGDAHRAPGRAITTSCGQHEVLPTRP